MAALLTGLTTFAFISRFFIIIVQILANNLIPDHNANVFSPPGYQMNNTILDSVVRFCLGGFQRWDAVYFTHIAEHGYSYENCVAFFPFYPLIVSLFSRLVYMLGILQLSQCVLLTGVVINCAVFALTARNLYNLSIETGWDAVTSLVSVFVFCVNPASIFMTAPYSETLYFYFLVLSLRYIKKGLVFRASITIAVSIAVRSNGLVGIGFVLYNVAQTFIHECFFRSKGKRGFDFIRKFFFLIVRDVLKVVVCVTICFSTFVLYQYYIYEHFCLASPDSMESLNSRVISYGRDQGYKIVGDPPSSWCFQKLPISYSYIQAEHWGVGFLQYYKIKQIPNFLLASPVVLLSFYACSFFFKMNREVFLTLGLSRPVVKGRKNSDNTTKQQNDNKNNSCNDKTSLIAGQMVVYVFHMAFLTLFGCSFIHIQVLTRLLFSSSPLLYWYAGSVLTENPLVTSYVKNLIPAASSDTVINQKLCGNITGRKDLTTEKKELNNDSHPFGLWTRCLKLCCCFEIHFVSNIGVKFFVFLIRNWTNLTMGSKAILVYCVAYVLIGTTMFSNFLPWT